MPFRATQNTYKTLMCLFLVYISWGSTFISNRFALESFPPFMLCCLRMTAAGSLLYFITWLQGEKNSPTRQDLRQTFILAIFMVLVASGFLAKGQESVPSGTAAMISGSVPLWMVLGGWLFFKEPRPGWFQAVGLAGGTGGLCLLSIHQGIEGITSPFGLTLVVTGTLGWVVGSFYSKRHASETQLSVMRNSALLMLLGGLQALVVSMIVGEHLDVSAIRLESCIALSSLILLSALVGYTCYFWLLLHTRTAVAISFEYVNPVIGVFLGWLLGGEMIDSVVIFTCCCIVGSVFFIVSNPPGRKNI